MPGGDGIADERHYSVWKSTAEGRVDLCVTLHGLGPGSRWASRCAVGNPVEISRSNVLSIALDRSTETHLFFGDETSIAAAEAMIRALPAETVVLACFEAASTDHRWPQAELRALGKHSLGSSSRATRLRAPLLARGPEPLVHEFHDPPM